MSVVSLNTGYTYDRKRKREMRKREKEMYSLHQQFSTLILLPLGLPENNKIITFFLTFFGIVSTYSHVFGQNISISTKSIASHPVAYLDELFQITKFKNSYEGVHLQKLHSEPCHLDRDPLLRYLTDITENEQKYSKW